MRRCRSFWRRKCTFSWFFFFLIDCLPGLVSLCAQRAAGSQFPPTPLLYRSPCMAALACSYLSDDVCDLIADMLIRNPEDRLGLASGESCSRAGFFYFVLFWWFVWKWNKWLMCFLIGSIHATLIVSRASHRHPPPPLERISPQLALVG